MYQFPRIALYAFLFAVAVVELGLTAYRIHYTRTFFHFYDPIIVELLVASCLAIILAPVNIFMALSADLGDRNADTTTPFTVENILNFIIWVMFLVGGAIVTHYFPNPILAGGFKQGHILLTIVAFSWLAFAALSLAFLFSLMHFAARRGLDRRTPIVKA